MSLLISKAISQLLLPPGGLILLAVAGLIGWKARMGKFLVVLSLLSLWLLSIEPVRDALLSPLENRYPVFLSESIGSKSIVSKQVHRESAVIVLLGGGINAKAPEYGGRDVLSRYAMMRTVYAADLAERTSLDIYTTGGSVLSETSEPEGLLMQRMLIRLGVVSDRIHIETKANNTWENAANLQQVMQAQGSKTIVLVTTAWHMPRSVWSFEQHGFTVIPAPCDYVVEREPYDIRSWLPRWNVMADSADGLHEYLGLLWYRLRYG